LRPDLSPVQGKSIVRGPEQGVLAKGKSFTQCDLGHIGGAIGWVTLKRAVITDRDGQVTEEQPILSFGRLL
jgi:hypothetical protein